MVITFDVSGFYDWEPADQHPGVKITEADVKQLRAKKLADDRWAIRVEKTLDTHHDTCIPEVQICSYLVGRTAAGDELSRQDAVLHLLKTSAKHHVAKRHVKSVSVHDSGPVADLLRQMLADRGITGADADAAVDRYCEPCDMQAAISMQHVSSRKGA